MVLAHLLEEPSLLQSTDGKDRMSPLQVAAGYNAVDVCHTLIENGPSDVILYLLQCSLWLVFSADHSQF
jgi:hypothetical protein